MVSVSSVCDLWLTYFVSGLRKIRCSPHVHMKGPDVSKNVKWPGSCAHHGRI